MGGGYCKEERKAEESLGPGNGRRKLKQTWKQDPGCSKQEMLRAYQIHSTEVTITNSIWLRQKKKKKKADHLWHATYGKRSLYIGKILVRDKKRKRALGFERKTIRSSRTAQEVLEEESISSSKSVSVKAQREKGPWLPIHKWLMDGTGGLLSQIWARHWKGYRCVQRSIHSLQSFHSRAAEGKLTHTIPLTLNTVPITWEQKFKEERNQKERLKEESSQAKTWEVVRILIVCWEQKKEHRGVEKKHDLCSARQKGHIG